MMPNNKFKIGDKVTSVINPHFLGQIIGITERVCGNYYTITYFKDDEPLMVTMYEFELELVAENGKIGFQNLRKTSDIVYEEVD